MSTFAIVFGAITSSAALAAAAARVQRSIRQRRARNRLAGYLVRLRRLDNRLFALVSEAEARLTDGVGSYGFAILPPALRGHLYYLSGLLDELERTTATLRAFDAYGPAECLRQDLERLTVVMHEAGGLYESGIILRYQESDGGPIRGSAMAREPTPTLDEGKIERAEELRREAQLLFRTAHHQLYGEDAAESYTTQWPTQRRAMGKPSDAALWGNEVRPLEWSDTDLNGLHGDV